MVRRKKDTAAFGSMVVGAIILAPFVLLYEVVGKFWFLMIVLGIPILMVVGRLAKTVEKARSVKKVSSVKNKPLELTVHVAVKNSKNVPDSSNSAWIRHCNEIEQAWQRGDYDRARQELQRIASSMVGKSVTQEEKNRFTEVMKDFASEDPMYRDVMAIALPYIEENPGTLQSKIYDRLPHWNKEDVRYVLYFANELGHIHRIKKGNSYKLIPTGNVFDSTAL